MLAIQVSSIASSLNLNQGWCPENYSKIQTNCGPQCWTTVEITIIPGGFPLITNRIPTDIEASLYQAFANAECLQDTSIVAPRP